VGRGHGFHGRRAELAAVLSAVRDPASSAPVLTASGPRGRQGRLVIIRGAPGSGRSALLAAAGRTLQPDTRITGVHDLTKPGVLLIDDADALPVPLLLASRRTILATCRTDAGELAIAADTVIDLGPLDETGVAGLLSDYGPLDDTVTTALRTALGPLLHNPGALVTTLQHLRTRLVPVADQLCLRDLDIALPAELCPQPNPVLTAVAILGAVRTDALPVLAAALGLDAGECGRTIDALVDAELLTDSPDGHVRCVCPALATTIRHDAGPAAAQRLHDALATELIERHAHPALIADHLAAAGRALPSSQTTWLIDLADRTCIAEPHRAARWYAAALRHVPPDRQEHANVLTFLLRLLVQNGQYDLLSEVLADEARVAATDPAVQDDLEAAAMLTAFHTGHPVKVAHEPIHGGPLDLYGWWLGEHRDWIPLAPGRHDALLTSAELNLIFYALSVDPAGCEREITAVRNPAAHHRLQELIEVGSGGDPASSFEIILGPRYSVPAEGPLALGRTVVQGYAAADFTGAQAAARRLELAGPPDSPTHQLSRIYAAAIHTARGEHEAASTWLAMVSHDVRFAAARTTVEIILLHHAGDSLGAVNLAWFTYRQARRVGALAGVERLMLLALQIALRGGDRPMAAALLEEIEQLYQRAPWRCTKQVTLLGRGLMHGDPAAAAEGANLSAQRRHRPDLLWACRILAQFCDEPGPVISQLNALAHDGGSFLLPAQLSALMRKYGVPDPRPAGFNTGFTTLLSNTETRIVGLIRTGHTNRQIAAILHLSVKTIENHLTRLFTRTGCRSRVELAAASIDGRLKELGS
jgi:DNA-binding CsgD family transcriptional regulator